MAAKKKSENTKGGARGWGLLVAFVLVVAFGGVAFYAIFYGREERNDPEIIPVAPVYPGPIPDFYLPLSQNFSDSTGANYTLTGTFDTDCEPRFGNQSLPDQTYGGALYVPCDDFSDFAIVSPSPMNASFTLVFWAIAANASYVTAASVNGLSLSLNFDNGRAVMGSSTIIVADDMLGWTFVAASYDVDEALLIFTVNQDSENTTAVSSQSPLKIGGSWFSGWLFGVQGFNRALTTDEIQAVRNNASASFYYT